MRIYLVLGCLMLLALAGCKPTQIETGTVSVYDRIMATQTLRCGYIVYPPNLIKDAASGKFSGISYDIMTRLGHDLGLKIEWVEEVGTGSMIEGLNTGRYDLLCTSIWAEPTRGKVAQFSIPLYFTSINAYVRTDDVRFSENSGTLNTDTMTIATIDGGLTAIIARDDYPQAKTYSLPELTDFSQLLLALTTRKADVTFSEAAQVVAFEQSNPGTLKNLTPDRPARLFANVFTMKMDEARLAEMLDNALRSLHNEGFIEKTIASYEQQPNEYRRVAPAYK